MVCYAPLLGDPEIVYTRGGLFRSGVAVMWLFSVVVFLSMVARIRLRPRVLILIVDVVEVVQHTRRERAGCLSSVGVESAKVQSRVCVLICPTEGQLS